MNDVAFLEERDSPKRAFAPPIAELMMKRNTVRVQAPGDLVWDETKPGQTLHRRDSVLTMDQAKAELAFLDGTALVLDENSLIQLEKNPSDDSRGYQKIVVRLLRGRLHKRSPRGPWRLPDGTPDARTLEVQVGSAVAALQPETELTITALPEQVSVQVHQGELELTNPSQKLKMIPGEEATFADGGATTAPRTRRIPLTLESPRANEVVPAAPGKTSVEFAWRAAAGGAAGAPQDLEASLDPHFKGDVLRVRIPYSEPPLKEVKASMSLPSGSGKANRWHWRVRSHDGSMPPSAVESFWLVPPPTPALRIPAEKASFATGTSVELLWSAIEGATGYAVELVTPETEEKPRELQVGDATLRLDSLASGSYRWRVRALAPGPVAWSASREFVVRAEKPLAPEQASELLPPPPSELLEPEIDPGPAPTHSWLEMLFWSSAWAEETAAASWNVKLKWRAVPGIRKYKVQIGRERTFRNIITENVTDAPELLWKYQPGMENTKGRIFFRVASVSENGSVGRFSDPKPVQLRNPAKPEVAMETQARRKAPVPTQAPRKPPVRNENYAAIDESAGEPEPTDAAPGGDLHTLASKPGDGIGSVTPSARPAPAVPAPSPSPAPSATPAIAAAPIISASPSPAPTSAPSPAPAQEPSPYRSRFSSVLALSTGIGSEAQSGADPALTSVAIRDPHLQQKISVGAELLRLEEDRFHSRWSAFAQLSFAKFSGIPGARPVEQPEATGWSFRAAVLRHDGLAEIASGEWALAYGFAFDRCFRWQKSGRQAVLPEGALSAGPVGAITHRIKDFEIGMQLGIPLTGALTDGFVGANASLWSEWRIWSFGGRNWLGLRLEAEGTLQRWSTPESTTTRSWVTWLAPTFHFGQGEP